MSPTNRIKFLHPLLKRRFHPSFNFFSWHWNDAITSEQWEKSIPRMEVQVWRMREMGAWVIDLTKKYTHTVYTHTHKIQQWRDKNNHPSSSVPHVVINDSRKGCKPNCSQHTSFYSRWKQGFKSLLAVIIMDLKGRENSECRTFRRETSTPLRRKKGDEDDTNSLIMNIIQTFNGNLAICIWCWWKKNYMQ